MYIVNVDELYHHGIKGMKWGVRRYQNKDGSLTAAGKKQAKSGGDSSLKAANQLSSSTQNITRASQSYVRGKVRSNYNPKSISKMTDDELRRRINRMRLEHDYEDVMVEHTMRQNGYRETQAMLQKAGDIVTIGTGLVGMAVAIKKLKG